jgi:hypothetical protein
MVLRGCKAGGVNVGAGARALRRPDFLSSTVAWSIQIASIVS